MISTTLLALAGSLLLARGLAVAGDLPLAVTPSPGNRVDEFVAEQIARGAKPNGLFHEKSPYLLQHAFNPVDWYPWGEEAFNKARAEGKPIFLSIGYSTCHWCHVMARESFENPEIAALLNRYFVAIKVDREERPDLDHIYMTVTQMLSGSGGWPMSVFLTPELKPFYAGTYFPPKSAYGRPGFVDLLESIHLAWEQEHEKVVDSADRIMAHLEKITIDDGQRSLIDLPAVSSQAVSQLKKIYDRQNGGFGPAPKFPRPVTLNFLFRYQKNHKDRELLDMGLTTLKKMAAGGMNDQLAGGFHRYSVDGHWLVPHFEKMLYDQAQLAVSFLDAYQISRDEEFAKAARATLDYVRNDLTSPEGGFYSAEDADSALPEDPQKHGEGAFYIWKAAEISLVLGNELADIFNFYYGVKSAGNVSEDPQAEFTNKNILHQQATLAMTAKRFNKPEVEIVRLLEQGRTKLLATRAKRPRPQLDDKILVSWNGLMISALARGYQVLGDQAYLDAATKAADFILTRLYDADKKRLLRRYRSGEAGLEAHLADYAFLVQGLIDLYQATFDIKYMKQAVALTETMIVLFGDPQHGGFFETSGADKSVLVRMKEDYDGAEPAANSVAIFNLLRLARMTGNPEWLKMARHGAESFSAQIKAAPTAMPQLLAALDFAAAKPMQIIVTGNRNQPETRAMLAEIHQRYLPNTILLGLATREEQQYLAGHLPFVADMAIDRPAAYICEIDCKLPAHSATELAVLLDG